MKLLKKIFQRKPKIMRTEKHVLIESFELRGTKYYQFSDTFNMPTQRAMAALTIYTEFDMRLTREYLELHLRAVDKLLNPENKRIDIVALGIIHNNLRERLNLLPFPDYVYKLASVLYIDETEDPYSYDYEYNEKKIKKWKAAGGTLDFFCRMPLKSLMPFIRPQAESVDTYFDLAEDVNKLHQNILREIISRN